jgi:hypothetical protein
MKTCTCCQQTLSDEMFHKRTYRNGRVGLQPKCKKCATENRRQYYKPHEYMRRKFNLTDKQYAELMKHDNCEVCGRDITNKKCIDHCHNTEKIRGVLCNNCNTTLGLVGDNVQVLTELIRYLERSEQLE